MAAICQELDEMYHELSKMHEEITPRDSVWSVALDEEEEQQHVPTNLDKILNLKGRVELLERDIERMKEMMKDGMKRPTVSSADLEKHIDDALEQQPFGVSKPWMRRCLEQAHGITDRKYMRRRLNALLKKKLDKGLITFDKGLYFKSTQL